MGGCVLKVVDVANVNGSVSAGGPRNVVSTPRNTGSGCSGILVMGACGVGETLRTVGTSNMTVWGTL